MFTGALFILAGIGTQPKCPSTEERIKKMQYIYTMKYYAAIKNEIMSFVASWMDLEIVTLTEESQKKTTHDFACMWNLKRCYKYMKFLNTASLYIKSDPYFLE